jgi:hypothetical protein
VVISRLGRLPIDVMFAFPVKRIPPSRFLRWNSSVLRYKLAAVSTTDGAPNLEVDTVG